MTWIERLEAELEQLHEPTAKELSLALQSAACAQEDIAPYIMEPVAGRAYGRNVLYRSQHVEAVVIHLPLNASTAIHDHGDSVGCAEIVQGSLRNVMYRKAGFGMAAETGAVTVRAGQHMIAPYGQIHRMIGNCSERTVSLHLYAPPLAGMKYYLSEKEAVLDYVI